jgi:hypothetical protein
VTNTLKANLKTLRPAMPRMMDADIVAMNLAGVESHFHAEDTGSVSAALEAFTDDCVWEAPNPNGLNKRLVGKAELGPCAPSERARTYIGRARRTAL